MEKRALIAFVLSLAILLFWQYFFGGLYQPSTPPPAPPQQTEPVTPAPPAVPQQTVPSGPQTSVSPHELPKDRIAEAGRQFKSWAVDTSLYKMKILAPGARIDSFLLKKFREEVSHDSPPMQLVPTGAIGYPPLAVYLLHHQDWQLATREYVSQSPPQLTLSPAEKPKVLSLQSEIPGRLRLTKDFTFIPGTYLVDVEIRLQNLSQEKLDDQLGIDFYFDPYANESSYNKSTLSSFSKGTLTNLQTKQLTEKEVTLKPPLDWVGYENNYFIQALIPQSAAGYEIFPRLLDDKTGFMQTVYLTNPLQIEPGKEETVKLRLYMGPKEMGQLEKAGHHLDKAINYGWFTVVAVPLFYVLEWFYKYTHNYGVAIILLTVLIKIVFWPLTHKSYKSMQMMKKIQPKIAQIREKYKDDREKLNQELMGVYRTYKVNPLGGCLPMVLQIPVFFALYRMLYGAVELRHKPFCLWINDLTAPDRLHIGISIPYLGGIPVLTLLMGVSMFIQQKMTPSGGDPRQEQLMLLMPVVFTVFFINFPSGLVLYWLVNNILSIAQQYWINRSA
jgi:YidC/Oxa1 family membrane protein insertase